MPSARLCCLPKQKGSIVVFCGRSNGRAPIPGVAERDGARGFVDAKKFRELVLVHLSISNRFRETRRDRLESASSRFQAHLRVAELAGVVGVVAAYAAHDAVEDEAAGCACGKSTLPERRVQKVRLNLETQRRSDRPTYAVIECVGTDGDPASGCCFFDEQITYGTRYFVLETYAIGAERLSVRRKVAGLGASELTGARAKRECHAGQNGREQFAADRHGISPSFVEC